MNNRSLIKFLGGAAFGAGIAMAINNYLKSESGQMARQKIMEMSSDFYENVKDKKKVYNRFLCGAAKQFGKLNKIAPEKIDELIDKTNELWDGFAEQNPSA